jgi:hypothetical protein
MSTPSLKKTILEKVQLFHAKCEKERNDILQRDREEKRKEEEKEERKQHLQNKFNETILKDLKALFDEVKSLFSTPYIHIVLESHGKSNIFYLHDREKVPAFAFFGVDAISREGQEAFYRARYFFLQCLPQVIHLTYLLKMRAGCFQLTNVMMMKVPWFNLMRLITIILMKFSNT